MSTRGAVLAAALIVLVSSAAYAQSSPGGYFSVQPAVSAGDGGAAPAVSGSIGYMTPRRIGFELEFSYTDRLDLDRDVPQIQSLTYPVAFSGSSPVTGFELTSFPVTFPSIEMSIRGRLLAFNTNAVGEIAATRRFRATVTGGGGVASLRQRVHVRISPGTGFSIPELPANFFFYDQTVSGSDAGLLLNAGVAMEYLLSRRIGVAGEVRYLHVFVEPRALDMSRVGGRFICRF